MLDKKEFNFFESEKFKKYAIEYNLVYQDLIVTETVIADANKNMLLVVPQGKKATLCICKKMSKYMIKKYFESLSEFLDLNDIKLREIRTKDTYIKIFSEIYKKNKKLSYKITERTIAYYCEKINFTENSGEIFIAGSENAELVGRLINNFEEESFKNAPNFLESLKKAEDFLKLRQVYLWKDKGQITAMALVTMRTKQLGRINYVYVKKDFRRKGYSKMIISSLAEILQSENRLPVLYTDEEYLPSNESYVKIGFKPKGKLYVSEFYRIEVAI